MRLAVALIALYAAACESAAPVPAQEPSRLSKSLAKGCSSKAECDGAVDVTRHRYFTCTQVENADCNAEGEDLRRAQLNREAWQKHEDNSFDESREAQKIHADVEKGEAAKETLRKKCVAEAAEKHTPNAPCSGFLTEGGWSNGQKLWKCSVRCYDLQP